ncbi:glycosyltransferase family 87 protein [Bradyrhizobium sp. STM 3557]|uniref:glycosyltransferase family 87 protein n=1 Tax=Bradyrhizobium sp. STM 3557 TaxID=578920 RepID=UPI00388D9778
MILGAALTGALYALYAGEDVNWDWQNYHDYAGFALLHGRFDVDVAPGGFQSYLNPLIYTLPYLARHGLGAPWWGIVLGALHGLNLALIYWTARNLLGRTENPIGPLASAVVAAFGPMTLSEVGTSFADILTALPIIAGVALMFADDDGEGQGQLRRLVIAGVLIGAATGLKLTNAVFLIGAGISLLLLMRPLPALLCFGIGSGLGMLATGGAWAFHLWRAFGSPLFPFYNTIFHASEAPVESIVDTRFMPHGLLDALAYPFYWLIGRHPSSEWPFRDPRFALVIVLMLLVLCASIGRRRELLGRKDRRLLFFFWGSYIPWLLAFSIQRYAIVLELLSAPLIVLLLTRLGAARRGEADAQRITPSHGLQLATGAVALAIALWSQPTDWMRRPWSDPYRPQVAEALQAPATFLLLQKPLGYIVPLLPQGSRAYQISDVVLPVVPDGVLDRRIRAGLAQPLPGGLWALHLAESPEGNPLRLDLLDAYDLRIDPDRACLRIAGAERIDVMACPLIPRATKASTAELNPSASRN